MSEWDTMRECFCKLWFGETTPADNNNNNNNNTRGENEVTVNDSWTLSFDERCASLWGSSTSYTPSYANVIEELLYTRVAVSYSCLTGEAVSLFIESCELSQLQYNRV